METNRKETVMQKKPRVFKAVVTAILCLAIFGAVYLLAYLILGGIFNILAKIPVIRWLLNLLFFIRGDTPGIVLLLVAPILAYYATMVLQQSVNKEKPTMGLSCILLGIFLTTIHALSLIVNLINGESVFPNITQAIAGLVIFFSGRGVLKEPEDT